MNQIFKILTAVVLVFNCILLSTYCIAEEKQSPKKYFGSVSRIHYRYSIDGENTFALGYFRLLPKNFFLAASAEFYTAIEDHSPFSFSTHNIEVNIGRSWFPSTPWGRAFGWVLRYQCLSGNDDAFSAGLQWTFSKTPGVLSHKSKLRWKSFIQTMISNDKRLYYEIFHWYQFDLIPKRLIFRGTNNYYAVRDGEDAIRTIQDIIYPLSENTDIYLRHFHQNNAINKIRGEGSQFLIGLRYSLPT